MTFFFYGPNTHALRAQVQKMIEAYLAKAGSDTELIRLDGGTAKPSELRAALLTVPFLAQAYLSNGFDQVPKGQTFDLIVSNVPAKIGSELLTIFLHDAHNRLTPGGRLYIVTISGLKDYMKRHLTATFGNYDKLKQSKTYTAALAVKR